MALRAIVLVVFLVLVVRALLRFANGIREGVRGITYDASGVRTMHLVRDPVCGTYVTPRERFSASTDGATHYFCSDACRTKYLARR